MQGIELLCKGMSDQIVQARLNLSDRPEMKRRRRGEEEEEVEEVDTAWLYLEML